MIKAAFNSNWPTYAFPTDDIFVIYQLRILTTITKTMFLHSYHKYQVNNNTCISVINFFKNHYSTYILTDRKGSPAIDGKSINPLQEITQAFVPQGLTQLMKWLSERLSRSKEKDGNMRRERTQVGLLVG